MRRKPGPALACTLAGLVLAGCAQTECVQPDVLAYVDSARRSGDLYAVGLTADRIRQTPLPLPGGTTPDPHAALCSAWLLSRNPAFQPGNGQARTLRERQDFRVVKLPTGYEVSLYRPVIVP